MTSHWPHRRSTWTCRGAPCLESSYTRRRRGRHREQAQRPPDDCAAWIASPSTRTCPTSCWPVAGRHCRRRPTRRRRQPSRRNWSPVRRRDDPTAPAVTASSHGRRLENTPPRSTDQPAILLRGAARWLTWRWRTAAAVGRWRSRTRSWNGRHAEDARAAERYRSVPRHCIITPWSPWTQALAVSSRNVDELTPPRVHRSSVIIISIIIVRTASRDKANVTSHAVSVRWRPSTRNKRRRRHRVLRRQRTPAQPSSVTAKSRLSCCQIRVKQSASLCRVSIKHFWNFCISRSSNNCCYSAG